MVDADVAVISSIGIDHVDYLGGTRESIGFEKAGILRSGRPGVCADPDPPQSLLAHARAIGAPLMALHHVQDLDALLRSLADLLVKGGRLAIADLD